MLDFLCPVLLIVATTEFLMGLWGGWPSWALVKRPQHDTPAEWLSRNDHSWAVASLDLANMMTALPAGILANWMGRKGCLLAVGCGVTASFGMLYAPSRWAIFIARAIVGICKSVVYVTVPGYLGEVSLNMMRGRLNVVAAVFDSLGMLIAMTAGPLIPYNVMNGLSVATGLVFLVAVSRIPETPIYLLSKGRTEKARLAFKWYRPSLTATEHDEQFNKTVDSVQDDMAKPGTYHELFTDDGNRVALLLVMCACFAQRASGISCVIAYLTTTLRPDGPIHPDYVATTFACIRLTFTMVAGTLVDRCGRRPLLITSHLCMATVTAAYAAHLYVYGEKCSSWAPCTCIVLFTLVYSMGAGVVPGTLLGEMFPANVKSKAVSIVSIVASLGSFITNKMYLPVTDSFGEYIMFLVFCTINATWALCAFIFLFETGGMTLSGIQDVLDEYESSSSIVVTNQPPRKEL